MAQNGNGIEAVVINEMCNCGCGIEFIPNTSGFRLSFFNNEGVRVDGYSEWQMANDTWLNFIPYTNEENENNENENENRYWCEFNNLIIGSHLNNPNATAWTHLYNAFCNGGVEFQNNTRFTFNGVH